MQNVALFCNLVALILGRNCVKDLRGSKILQNQVSMGLEQVRSKKLFPKTIMDKMFETNSGVHMK